MDKISVPRFITTSFNNVEWGTILKTIFRLNAVSKALSTAALLAAPLVATAGIGNIRVQSGQGEPLSATVTLSGEEAEAAVLNGAFSATGSVPLNVRVSGSQEQPVLIITSSSPITEEITSLSVRAGDSVRLFSVALKPAASAETPKEEAAPAAEKEQKTEQKVEEPKDNSIALGSKYTTKRKETVHSIAQRMTDSKASNQQKIQAIVDKNPNAFVNGNSRRMKSGAVLTIPTADEIADIERKLAEKAAADKAKKEAEEKARAEKAAEDKAKKEAEAEKAAQEKRQKEQEAQAKREAEEKAKAEKAEAERLKKEQEAAEKAAAEQAQKEAEAKAAQEKAEAERLQAEQAAQQAAEPTPAPVEETPVVEQQPTTTEESTAPQAEKSGGIAKYIAGGLLALAVIGGFLLARRKGGSDDEDEKPSFKPASTGTVAGTVVKPTQTEEEETVSLKDKFFPAPEPQITPTENREEVAEDIRTVELPNLDITQAEESTTSVSEVVENIAEEVADEVVEPAVEPVVETEPISTIEPLDISEPVIETPPTLTINEISTPQASQEGDEFVLNFGGDHTQDATEERIETPDNTFDFDFSDNDLAHPAEKLQSAYEEGVDAITGEPSRRTPSVEDALQEGEKQKLAFDPNIGLDFILDDTPVAETIQSATQDENYEEPVSIRQYDPAPLMRLDSDLNISETLRANIEDMATPVAEEEPPAPLAVEEETTTEQVVEEPAPVLEETVSTVAEEPPVEEPTVVESEPEPLSLVEETLEALIEQATPAVEEVATLEPEPLVEEEPLSLVEEPVIPEPEPVAEVVPEEPELLVEPPAPTVEEQAGAEESPIPVATEVVEEVEQIATPEQKVLAPTDIPLDDTNAPLLAKLELAKMYLSQNDTEGTLEVLVDILDSCPPDSPIYKEAEKMFNTLDT
ncbi:MAG: hypothetical protein J6M43_08015 [Neisseriaceae bacterium]|nr:hypothetical protein [Neisseriaceae bacterium]